MRKVHFRLTQKRLCFSFPPATHAILCGSSLLFLSMLFSDLGDFEDKTTKHLSYKNCKGALNNNNHKIYSTSKYKIIYKKFSHPQVEYNRGGGRRKRKVKHSEFV